MKSTLALVALLLSSPTMALSCNSFDVGNQTITQCDDGSSSTELRVGKQHFNRGTGPQGNVESDIGSDIGKQEYFSGHFTGKVTKHGRRASHNPTFCRAFPARTPVDLCPAIFGNDGDSRLDPIEAGSPGPGSAG
jgi:hypothetical protein